MFCLDGHEKFFVARWYMGLPSVSIYNVEMLMLGLNLEGFQHGLRMLSVRL